MFGGLFGVFASVSAPSPPCPTPRTFLPSTRRWRSCPPSTTPPPWRQLPPRSLPCQLPCQRKEFGELREQRSDLSHLELSVIESFYILYFSTYYYCQYFNTL